MNYRSKLPLILFFFLPHSFTHGAVSWSFDYTGLAEFDTSAQGLERRASLEAAAASLGAWFSDTATVTIAVTSFNDPQNSQVATANSNLPGLPVPGFGLSTYVRNRILTGAGNPRGADATVKVNFSTNWDFDDTIAADAVDFKATMMHELLHTMGFLSIITQEGNDGFGRVPGRPGQFTLFDKYLTDAAGTPIIDQTTFELDGALWAALSVGGGTRGNPLGDGTLTKPGQPLIRVEEDGDTRALYVRRKDFSAVGLTYLQHFSTDLTTWRNSGAAPLVLADDGSHEVVSVPLPADDGEGKAFFLLEVRIAP